MKIDKTDLAIVSILRENGRIQNNEIAQRLSISEGTVRNRIKKLVDSNYLLIKGMVNPVQIIDKQIVLLSVCIAECKELEKAADVIADLPNVESVYMVAGKYDLIVELFIEPHNLLRFISVDLAKVRSIASTESFIVLKTYKKWI